MKTRSEELETTVREALRMLAQGCVADAQTTLEAGLDLALQPGDRAVRPNSVSAGWVSLLTAGRDALACGGDVVRVDAASLVQLATLALAARDAALEEAARVCRETFDIYEHSESERGQVVAEAAKQLEQDIRALRRQPAQSIPVAKVREACMNNLFAPVHGMLKPSEETFNKGVRAVAHDLGVPLDVEAEKEKAP